LVYQSPSLFILDGDRSAATFGAVLQQVPWSDRISLSADGTKALTRVALDLILFDVDPVSATYLQPLRTMPITSFTPFNMFATWLLSSDGRWGAYSQFGATVGIQQIDRADFTTGQWIDHNSAQPGIQPLGLNSSQPLPQLNYAWWLKGGRSLVTRDGAGGYLRVNLDSGLLSQFSVSPASFNNTPGAGFPIGASFVSASTSERFFVERWGYVNGSGGANFQLNLVHIETGAVGVWLNYSTPNLNSLANPPTLAWR
jgi:hypothetical protein